MKAPATTPRALLLRCLTLGCVAALPVAFSAWIDPGRLRPWPDDERAIANALLAGHYVTDVVNFNDRAIEQLLAQGRTRAPDVLAIGSSRIQPLPASAFPGVAFVNAGVAGAGLDDMLAVYALYDTATRRPHRVVVNLDPWTTDRDDDDVGAWGRISSANSAMRRRLGDAGPPWGTGSTARVSVLRKLAAPEYFRLAVFSVRKYGPAGIRFVVTDRAQNDEKTKSPDGTLVWSRNPPEKTEHLALAYVRRMRRGTAPYDGRHAAELSDRARLLEQFIRYLRGQGLQVDLLLVPFHPAVFAEFARRSRNPLVDAAARAREIARRTGAHVVGDYDPSTASATAADFFDESHMRPEALARLFGH